MHPTPAKLGEDGITAYAISADNTWNLFFY